ncbi:MAG TPA: DUF4040 domain-containing protein [Firmicutes bacterium]|nr:MAG: hypothetical protein DRP67_02200 [Candidatus Omnitrophota bacterium]HDD65067.1 DUF4040 domain-containing protein [Bacillota bacterium]
MIEGVITLLLVFMIIGSIIALEIRDLLSAIIAVGVVGYFLCVIALLIGAPDIAITQLVVEVLSLIILIRVAIRRDLKTVYGNRELFGLVLTLLSILILFIFGMEALEKLPPFGTPSFTLNPDSPSLRYLTKGLKETGAANIVSSVILDYRAYDTFGEATVLFTAIIGALAILRIYARKRREK